MPKHGSTLLYVHRNRRLIRELEDVLLVEFIYLVSLLACPVRVITDNSGQLLCQCVTSFDS